MEKEAAFFIKIFRRLGANQDPGQSISAILRDTCKFFGFYSGFVYEADHGQVFHLAERYAQTAGGDHLKQSFRLQDYLKPKDMGELYKKTGEIVYLNSRKNQLGAKFLDFFSAQTLIMVPVIYEDRQPVAFVGLMDRRRPIRLTKQEIGDADAVLTVLAGHIRTRIYQKRLRELAEHDTLTALPNRRKFLADLDEKLAAKKKGFLLFMDLDDFKKTNDTLGHIEGDALLRNIGGWLYTHRKQFGIPYRYGGDEFVILFERGSAAAVKETGAAFLKRFSRAWKLDEHSVKVGISIGACPYPAGTLKARELIVRADTAMYDVKHSGKHGFKLIKPPK